MPSSMSSLAGIKESSWIPQVVSPMCTITLTMHVHGLLVCSMCTIPLSIHGYGLLVCLFLTGTQATAKLDVNTLSHPTIRHRRCSVLLAEDASAQRCEDCGEYRKNLRAQLSRQRKAADNTASRTDPKSHVNIRYLQTPEMEARIQKLHDSTRTLAKKVGRLEAKINAAAEKAGVMVDEGCIKTSQQL